MPLAGSPLINAAAPPCSSRDRRNASRPDACNIGAVEYGGLVSLVYLPLIVKRTFESNASVEIVGKIDAAI
jgi:hypothetical protein